MQFTATKPIAEGVVGATVGATLKLVLQEIVKQNKICAVLTESRVVGLGTAEASVILAFDDAGCEKVRA